jgi:hypothetical protein
LPAIRSCVATELGKSPDEVRGMAISDALELMDHWAKYPTPSMMMRAYFGIKPPAIDEEEVRRAVEAPEVVAGLGQPQPPTDAMRSMIAWAEEQQKRLKVH